MSRKYIVGQNKQTYFSISALATDKDRRGDSLQWTGPTSLSAIDWKSDCGLALRALMWSVTSSMILITGGKRCGEIVLSEHFSLLGDHSKFERDHSSRAWCIILYSTF